MPHFELKDDRMETPLRLVSYPAMITASTLAQFPCGIRIWDTPRSVVEGAQVIDVLTAPTRVDVIAEQIEPFSTTAERLKIRYQSQEGWVLAMMLTLAAAS